MAAPLTPDRWLRIKAITADALERPEADRPSFLATASAGDETLRAEVESLLGAHAQAGEFLGAPALAETGAADAVAGAAEGGAQSLAAGRRIGPYRILNELGHGGMGVVYLAERADAAYEKQVAIKVVRAAAFAGESLMRRFREERQILATLDHPNIARLLDGGTTEEGLPYLVMEYVDGIALDVYAQKAPIAPRLGLFRQVCTAVQYAHQRLVIHRDLKARNILVTADGTPKLLDFGIAKLLEPGPDPEEQTRTAQRAPLTLEGASPEQVRGEPLTITSDVYALGVLLYRLLTGQSPYGPSRRTDAELMRAICEEQPVRPSAVAPIGDRRALRGELDWITLQALRKEPDRRYASADQLADDLQRHLDGRPVRAAPDSWSYRARKFAVRNRTQVGVGALLTLSLAAGVTATLWQARRAEEQRARAERRFNDVRKLATAVVGEVHDAIKDLPGATPARKVLVARAVEYLDSLAAEASGDESLQRELAGAYNKIGDAQGNPYLANLGEPAAALASYHKAYGIHTALASAHPGDPESQRALAASQDRLADMAWVKGGYPEALRRYGESRAIYESLAAADGARLDDRYSMGRVLNKIGQAQTNAGDLPGALQSYRQTHAVASGLASAAPLSVPYRRLLATAVTKIGDVAHITHDYQTAFVSYRDAEQTMRALASENPASADLRRTHSLVLARLGMVHMNLDRPAESVAVHRETIALQQAIAAADPDNVQTQFDTASVYGNLGQALHALGDNHAAAEEIRRGILIYERGYARNPGYGVGRWNYANLYLSLGTVLAKAGETARAIEAYAKAVSLFEVEPVRSENPAELAESYAGLGDAQAKLAAAAPPATRALHWISARRAYQESLAIWLPLRDQGKLPADQVDRAKQVEQSLARCGAALRAAQR